MQKIASFTSLIKSITCMISPNHGDMYRLCDMYNEPRKSGIEPLGLKIGWPDPGDGTSAEFSGFFLSGQTRGADDDDDHCRGATSEAASSRMLCVWQNADALLCKARRGECCQSHVRDVVKILVFHNVRVLSETVRLRSRCLRRSDA